jgi:hypothetical protein
MPQSGNSSEFLLWSRYGEKGRAPGAPVAGAEKLDCYAERNSQKSHQFCFEESVRALNAAVSSNAPKHMRSDVDRIVFGRDMDASEAAVEAEPEASSWNDHRLESITSGPPAASTPENALLARLGQQSARRRAEAEQRPTGDGPWAGAASEYIDVKPLNLHTPRGEVSHRRIGASRPTMVDPTPLTGNPKWMMIQQRNLPTYREELEKLTRRRAEAHARKPRDPRPQDREK